MVCPYFVETPLIQLDSRMAIAGVPKAKVEDVVEAATRFVAGSMICGRTLSIGPKFKVKEDSKGELQPTDDSGVEGTALVEINAHDFEEVEVVTRRMVALLNRLGELSGWMAVLKDVYAAVRWRLGL